MIPKVIHYIWLGEKPLPKIARKCIASWKKYCPDYEIKRWDESNLNIEKYQFAKDAYDAKKFAFVSDVFRTEILYKYGGVYLDVDVELLKPLDEFLTYKMFGGFETSSLLAPGLIWGTEQDDENLKKILDIYKFLKFDKNNLNNLTVCEIYTKYFEKLGLQRKNLTQKINEYIFFSSDYFCPIDVITSKKRITDNTHSIHWYNASWYSPKQKFKNRFKKFANILTFGLFGKRILKLKSRKNNEKTK